MIQLYNSCCRNSDEKTKVFHKYKLKSYGSLCKRQQKVDHCHTVIWFELYKNWQRCKLDIIIIRQKERIRMLILPCWLPVAIRWPNSTHFTYRIQHFDHSHHCHTDHSYHNWLPHTLAVMECNPHRMIDHNLANSHRHIRRHHYHTNLHPESLHALQCNSNNRYAD